MIDTKIIEKVSFHDQELNNEYYGYVFEHCDFSKLFLANASFEECEFISCDFSMTKFANIMRDTKFTECKMMGADFAELNNFASSFTFSKCNMSYASLARIKMKGTSFIECDMKEINFEGADLTSSTFTKCDLTSAVFYESNLERVDFSTAHNFAINPNVNKLKKTTFSQHDLRGLLSHLDIKIV